ncbi:MAG: DUF368 domain-containing protein [Planctomycetota bacterium]
MKSVFRPRITDLTTAARGFLMGAADIVPGVSGGTVALVLGIYQRLLQALSHFDSQLIGLLGQRRFADAGRHVDFRFLTALGLGIVVAVVSLAKLMHYLLEHHQGLTYAAFFGLILGSGVLVGRMCRPENRAELVGCIAIGLVAAVAALGILSQGHLTARPGLGYTFVSGAIAICAMILPGVSGSYLLLMLGKYHEITGIIKDLPKLAVTGGELATLAVFAAGCVFGLLLFSRVLRWLLAKYTTPTMAALCGFMIGSLYKIWPMQLDTTPSVAEFKEKIFEPQWPAAFDTHTATCLAIAVGAFLAVLTIDAWAKRTGSDVAHRLNVD